MKKYTPEALIKVSRYLEFLSANGWAVLFSKEMPARITIMYTECKRKAEITAQQERISFLM